MKMLFKNKTKYTKETYNEYLQFHQNKYGMNYKFSTIVTILLLSFCAFCNIRYANLVTGILILLALTIFCLYRFFYPIKKVKKELKTEKFKKEKEFIFTFYENCFIVSDGKNSDRLKYWNLHKVFETDSFFYLYINKDHAFLLNKSTFITGDTSKFLKFLKKKIWYKI